MRPTSHGGSVAKAWRRRVSTLARRTKETVHTYKFPLDTEGSEIDFDKAAATYNLTEGVGYGSLLGLVCAVHLSGFRLFSNTSETQAFRNRARYPNKAFLRVLHDDLGITSNAITPERLDLIFKSAPRAKEGLAPVWSQEAVRDRLYTSWVGQRPGDAPDPDLFALATGIGVEVAKDFSDWKGLADDAEGGLKAAHRYFQRRGDFPALDSLAAPIALTPLNTTIDHDSSATFQPLDLADETLIHQAVAVCAAVVKRENPDLALEDSKYVTKLQETLLSRQDNGLSWLFGRGYRYLREKTVDELVADFQIPDGRRANVEQLKAFADAIGPNPLFDTEHYSEFRQRVGGKARSWVSNYWKRLLQLQVWVRDTDWIGLPELMFDQRAIPLFRGLVVDAEELRKIAANLPNRLGNAADALGRLMGEGTQSASASDVDIVEQVSDEIEAFIGQLEQLGNQINQQLENETDEKEQEFLEQLKKTLSLGQKRPPAINRISGGVPDVADTIHSLESKLDRLLHARHSHFVRLATWAKEEGVVLDALRPLVETETRRLDERGATDNPKDLALRLLVQRIGRLANRLGADSAQQIQALVRPVFTERREFNLFFHNRVGSLYRSPFSTSRHQPYQADLKTAQQIDWMTGLEGIVADIRVRLEQPEIADKATLLRDLVQLEGFVFAQRLRALPEVIPSSLVQPRHPEDLGLPTLLSILLEAGTVQRETALKVFNLYSSAINGCLFQTLRTDFIARAVFQRDNTRELLYVPKDKSWSYPARLESAVGPIKDAINATWVQKDATGAVLPKETLSKLVRGHLDQVGVPEYLVQAPHDWYVPIDLRGHKPNIEGLAIEKETKRPLGLQGIRQRTAFRAIGASSFKGKFDAGLSSGDVKYGDVSLIMDQHHSQSVSFTGGRVSINYQRTDLRIEAALPVIDDRVRALLEPSRLFDRLIAIDLGERRIGYAIFDLKSIANGGDLKPMVDEDGTPLIGSVAVPSVRRLMKAVRTHRGRSQPNQRVNQTYSKALMQYRENVIGDVCNQIDTLCATYGGFPVLESSVMNFEVGSRQLEIVYGSVLHRYTFSLIDAHTNQRKEYWFTGEHWDHPYLMGRKWHERRKDFSGALQSIKLAPGVLVNPAGTSQRCHQCGRNPVRQLRGLEGSVTLDSDGQLALDDGTVSLCSGSEYPLKDIKRARREKRRLPENVPLSGKHRAQHVLAVARRNLRQPPESTRAKDTTQSRYTCLYVDCDYVGHADVNAAINIGIKYLEDRVDLEASGKKLSDLSS